MCTKKKTKERQDLLHTKKLMASGSTRRIPLDWLLMMIKDTKNILLPKIIPIALILMDHLMFHCHLHTRSISNREGRMAL